MLFAKLFYMLRSGHFFLFSHVSNECLTCANHIGDIGGNYIILFSTVYGLWEPVVVSLGFF